MAAKYLGHPFDIHGAGVDLVFPHNENERAQSICAFGEQHGEMAQWWLHNGLVTLNREKMSKSTGNVFAADEALARVRPQVLRLHLSAAHYRSSLDYSEEGLAESAAAYERLETFVRNAADVVGDHGGGGVAGPWDAAWNSFAAAMDDDVGVPRALAAVYGAVTRGNAVLGRQTAGELAGWLAVVRRMLGVLGLDPLTQWPLQQADGGLAPVLDALVRAREQARQRRDFATSDALRDAFSAAGVRSRGHPGRAALAAGLMAGKGGWSGARGGPAQGPALGVALGPARGGRRAGPPVDAPPSRGLLARGRRAGPGAAAAFARRSWARRCPPNCGRVTRRSGRPAGEQRKGRSGEGRGRRSPSLPRASWWPAATPCSTRSGRRCRPRPCWLPPGSKPDPRVDECRKLAARSDVPVREVPRSDLDRAAGRGSHQGIVLRVSPFQYAHPGDLLARAGARPPLLVALDGITDPHNLGAVVRCAAAFGAHGVVVPERRAAGVGAAAWKASAGALARVPVARATNVVRALRDYQAAGLFVVGLTAEGVVDVHDLEVGDGPVVLVIGSEGRGLSRLATQTCDLTARIPMSRGTDSLNAAVAAGIALAEVARRRAQIPSS